MAVRQLGLQSNMEQLPKIPTGLWLNWPAQLTTAALTLSTMYVWPVRLPRQQFTDIAAEVSTLGTSGLLRVGFYSNDDSQGIFPSGTVLLDAGTQSSATVGSKTWPSLTFTPPSEIVWFAMVAQTAACSVRCMTMGRISKLPITMVSGGGPLTNQASLGFQATGVTGALPANPTWTNQNVNPPKIFLKAA